MPGARRGRPGSGRGGGDAGIEYVGMDGTPFAGQATAVGCDGGYFPLYRLVVAIATGSGGNAASRKTRKTRKIRKRGCVGSWERGVGWGWPREEVVVRA